MVLNWKPSENPGINVNKVCFVLAEYNCCLRWTKGKLRKSLSSSQNIIAALDELGDNLAVDLVLGDQPREVSDERVGVVSVQVTSLQAELPISSKPGAPTLDPGESLKEFSAPRRCGDGKTCSGVLVKLVHYKHNLITPDASKQDSQVEIISSLVWPPAHFYMYLLLSRKSRTMPIALGTSNTMFGSQKTIRHLQIAVPSDIFFSTKGPRERATLGEWAKDQLLVSRLWCFKSSPSWAYYRQIAFKFADSQIKNN